MSPFLLATFVVFFLMAQRLTDIFVGGHYVCPSCGARNQRRHSSECPWGPPPSD
jgi:hypothetical protein